MSRSRKKFPGGTCCCCKSQKRGKTIASKRFRRRTRVLIKKEAYEHLPLKSIELTSSWDLGEMARCFMDSILSVSGILKHLGSRMLGFTNVGVVEMRCSF